jgi:hypothetical protein
MSSLFSAAPLQHPAAGSHLSPRRREHVAQPPTLTTSLSGLQYQGLGLSYSPAPNSTTSLSSPFSQSSNSTYLPSPGGVARGSSPMASRLSGVYNAPYNPREWGPVGGNSPALGSGQISGPRQSSTTSIAPAPPRQLASDGSFSMPSLDLTMCHILTTIGLRTSRWVATSAILTTKNKS